MFLITFDYDKTVESLLVEAFMLSEHLQSSQSFLSGIRRMQCRRGEARLGKRCGGEGSGC